MACGIGGVHNASSSRELLRALFSFGITLRHRGDESTGFGLYNNGDVTALTEYGDINRFVRNRLSGYQGHATTGMYHGRYSTFGDSTASNAQPIRKHSKRTGRTVIVGHNGTLINSAEVLAKHHYERETGLDSEAIAHLLADSDTFEEGAGTCCEELNGAFNFVAINDKGELAGFRDPKGFHPLFYAVHGDTVYIASEDIAFYALDIYDGITELQPGELVVVSESGIDKKIIKEDSCSACSFQRAYFMHHGSAFGGVLNSEHRKELGRRMIKTHGASCANIIVPVMDSGLSYAEGASDESGIPLVQGLVRNSGPIGRTYISPEGKRIDPAMAAVHLTRYEKAFLKNVAIPSLVRGRSVEVHDDSEVRGNVSMAFVKHLRSAGAREIHVRFDIPPVRYPCFMGLDHATRRELAAAPFKDSYEAGAATAEKLGVESVKFMPLDVYKEVTGDGHCYACHDGNYPIEIPNTEPFISALRLD